MAKLQIVKSKTSRYGEEIMLGTILIILLVLLLLGALPIWPYSRGWGYTGSGVLGILLVLIILALVFNLI